MSADAFATLRPANALARLAFSDLYETFTIKRRNGHENSPSAFYHMVVEPSQTLDGDVPDTATTGAFAVIEAGTVSSVDAQGRLVVNDPTNDYNGYIAYIIQNALWF